MRFTRSQVTVRLLTLALVMAVLQALGLSYVVSQLPQGQAVEVQAASDGVP